MTTDEALRMINVDYHEVNRAEEENKQIRSALKKNGIPFADNLSANLPNPYLVTEPLLKLYAEGRRAQAVLSERAYLEWLIRQKQVDLNADETDEDKEDKESKEMAALIEKYM